MPERPIQASQVERPTPGQRIAVLRKRRRLTQAELAERVGVHRVTVTRYERDRERPTLATAFALAKVLGTKVDHLFSEEES